MCGISHLYKLGGIVIIARTFSYRKCTNNRRRYDFEFIIILRVRQFQFSGGERTKRRADIIIDFVHSRSIVLARVILHYVR